MLSFSTPSDRPPLRQVQSTLLKRPPRDRGSCGFAAIDFLLKKGNLYGNLKSLGVSTILDPRASFLSLFSLIVARPQRKLLERA